MNTKRVIQYFATIAATGDLAKKKDSKMKVGRGGRLAMFPLPSSVLTSGCGSKVGQHPFFKGRTVHGDGASGRTASYPRQPSACLNAGPGPVIVLENEALRKVSLGARQGAPSFRAESCAPLETATAQSSLSKGKCHRSVSEADP